MKLTYQYISDVFRHYLSDASDESDAQDEIGKLLHDCIATNKKLWKLEDVARMHHLGYESVAKTKMEIDMVNHKRNETINILDSFLDKHLCNVQHGSMSKFYSESPGMLIDRLAILFIKQDFIQQLIDKMDDKHLRIEFVEKEQLLNQNITDLGLFLDQYFDRIRNGEAFFKIYRPLKIYNDQRIMKYIKSMTKE